MKDAPIDLFPPSLVGVCSLGLEDLEGAMPEVARGLRELLDYDGDVEDDFCLTFQVLHPAVADVVAFGILSLKTVLAEDIDKGDATCNNLNSFSMTLLSPTFFLQWPPGVRTRVRTSTDCESSSLWR